MAFDLIGFRDKYKNFYGDMPLEDVAKDIYQRGQFNAQADFRTWSKSAGIDSVLEEDRRLRNPTFEDKLRSAVEKPKGDGNIVKSFLQGGAEGLTTELPSMIGGALQFTGSHLPFKGIEKAGKSLKDWAEEKRQELYGPEIERTGLDRIVYEGTKMLAPSLIPGGVAGTIARGAKGVNALLKAGKVAEATAAAKSATNIAGGSAAALFGLSQAQQTKDTAEQEGVDPGLAPYVTGAIEAAGEFLGTKYLAKLFRLDEAEIVQRGTKEFVKDLIKTIGVETGTEIGQASGEAAVEKYSGIRPNANPIMEAIDVIGPTAFMTILTGGLAGAANKLRSQDPEEKAAAQYIEKLKAGAMFSMAINEGLSTGEYEGSPFTSDHAIEIIKKAHKEGIFDERDIDRFKDKYPQLRDGLNGVIAENITKKIDEAVTNTLTNEVTNTAQNLSDVPINEPAGREEELPPATASKVKKLQNQITKQEDYLARNANRKGETQYEKWAADLEQKKSKLAELMKPAEVKGGDQNGTLQTETEIEESRTRKVLTEENGVKGYRWTAAGKTGFIPIEKNHGVSGLGTSDLELSQAAQTRANWAIEDAFKEKEKPGEAPESVEPGAKAPELMTPEEFDAAKAQRDKELGHGEEGDTHGFIGNNQRIIMSPNERIPLRDALEANKPVNAALFDRYNKDSDHPLTLPEGYIKEGDIYIFKGEQSQVPPAHLSQTDAATVGVTKFEANKTEVTGKQPYELSRAEYVQAGGLKMKGRAAEHKKAVAQAIAEGKITEHPDYPELSEPKEIFIRAAEKRDLARVKKSLKEIPDKFGYEKVYQKKGKQGRGFYYVKMKVKEVKAEKQAPPPSGAENLVTFLQRAGKVKLGEEFQDKTGDAWSRAHGFRAKDRSREMGDIAIVTSKNGKMAMDEAADFVNAEGFRDKNGDKFTDKTLFEALAAGEGRNILHPGKAERIIEKQIEEKENEYWSEREEEYLDQQREALAQEGIDATREIEENSESVRADLISEIEAEGNLTEEQLEAAHDEISSFFDEMSKAEETPRTETTDAGEQHTLAGLSANETFTLTAKEPETPVVKGAKLTPKNLQPKEKVGDMFAEQEAATEKAPAANEGSLQPQNGATADSGEELKYNKRNRIKTGIKWEDIKDKNTALKVKETNKQNVYPKPDYAQMVDDGMEPMIAHIVKQVYDSIPIAPTTSKTLTDELMQRYITAVNRVMDGTIQWANDKGAIAAWAGKQARYAGAALGKVTNLTDLAQSNKSLLDIVYPEGYKAYIEEIRILGGNKVLKALQPGYEQGRKAMKEIKVGWPGKLESWQKQGYAVVERRDVKVPKGWTDSNNNPIFMTAINGRTFGERYKTQEEAEASIDKMQPFILVDKYSHPIGQFDTTEEAQEAAREKVKRENKPTINEKGISVESAKRTGEQRREPGENITTDKLRETFGFKGVNFGNWMKGNTNEAERQLHLNHAYDSFMDLAEILNVPPKALSLNGFLGVAIGAQGSGAHAAHFVPGVNEINLTRTAGAGAMAHEWAHALDHYFANQAGLESGKVPYLTEHAALSATRTVMEKQDDGTWKNVTRNTFSENIRPEIVELFKKIVHAMNKKTINITPEEQAEQLAAMKEDSRKRIDSWLRTIREDFIRNKVEEGDFDKLAERIRNLDLGEGKIAVSGVFSMSPVIAELRNLYKEKAGRVYSLDQIKGLQSNIDHYKYLSEKENEEHIPQTREVGTDYGTESAKADKGKSKAYWSTEREMFARAFDAFVTDTIEEKAAINTYLSGLEAIPPKGEERKTINQAFKDLIQEIKTRETDKGIEMYSVRGMYSQLEKVVTEKLSEMPAKIQSIPKWLERQGVKPAEMKWMGVEQWLKENAKDGVIDKQKFADFLKENQIEVEEITKGAVNQRAINEQLRDLRTEKIRLESAAKPYTDNNEDAPQNILDAYTAVTDKISKLQLQKDRGDNTKFSQYQLPGGENYKEILMTIPSSKNIPTLKQYSDYYIKQNPNITEEEKAELPKWYEQDSKSGRFEAGLLESIGADIYGYKSPHWDEPNVLAHVRMNDRTDADGKKVLFIEEVQSDWLQDAKKKGFAVPKNTVMAYYTALNGQKVPIGYGATEAEAKSNIDTGWIDTLNKGLIDSINYEVIEKGTTSGVPPAPFADNWHEMVMKRMLRYAAENGYDKIAWTTGEQQAERYDLSKQISELDWWYNENLKEYYLKAVDNNGHTVLNKQKEGSGLSIKDVENTVGKEIAEKIQRDVNRGLNQRTLSGLDLKVGGEGMKSFYDNLIPGFMNRYVKQWGAKVGTTGIRTQDKYLGMADFIEHQKKAYPELTNEELRKAFENHIADTPVHSIDITPAMQESVMQGQPMYSKNTPGPYSMPTLKDVQEVFKGQKVTQLPTGAYLVETKNGASVIISAVDKITPSKISLSIGYSKTGISENEAIAGKYDKAMIDLVKGQADKWTLAHENIHWLEDIGVINDQEVRVLKRHIANLVNDGKWQPLNKNDIGGAEDRAEFLAQALQKEPRGLLGRIINKIQDFIDMLANAFGVRTVRGITRDIKTGEIYGHETGAQREARLDLEGGGIERSLADLYEQEKHVKFSIKEGTGKQEHSPDIKWWEGRDINAELRELPKKYWEGNVRDFIREGYVPITRAEADDLYKNKLDEFVSWVMLRGQETTGQEGLFMKPLTYQGYEPYYYEEEKHFRNAEAFGLYHKFRSRYLHGREREIAQQEGRDTSPISEEAPLQKVAESKEQYSIRKQTDPPVSSDPKVLNLYLKDETDAIVQTIMNKLHPKSMTWLETMLKSPEWFDHPQIQNIVKLFMRDRNEIYHETFNELNAFNDSTVTEAAKTLRNKGLSLAERLSGKVSPEYQTLMDMIDDGDTRWVRNKNIPLATQLQHFEDAWRKKGATDEIINVWRSFRQSYDKALDLMTAQLRRMIDEITEEARMKGEKPDLSELKQTLKGALAQMEEWRGFYAPRQRRGNWAVQAYKEHGPLEQNREWYRAHHESELSAQREAKKLERDGWKIYKVGETEKLPESVYQDVRAVSTAKLIDAALDKLGKKIDLDQMATFNAEILREVSDMIKSRGFRSTMIHRGRGNVVRGFIEDPIERHLMYINSVSGGISKARVARMAMQELLGDKEMGEPGIDPAKEPRAFSTAQNYIQEQLRNADASDRIIGLAKSIATFKFLGFNLRSLAVNTTAIVTTAPASIHQYAMGGKGSFAEIYRQLAKAGKDYGAAMAGKDLGNPDEAAFIADVHKKGWDDAQYTREALGEISKIHSRVWSTMMDASMYLFGVSEKWNRGTTMLAAYRLARKNGMSHDQAAETAKTSSDKAHGVYGKSTMPMWAQGTNPAAKLGQMMYVYSKFGHNYLQMLYDMGFKKKNIKGAMFAFLSPLVLAGGAAFPFKDAIFGFAGFILGLLGFDRDPEKWVWDQIREHLGGDAEKFGRHGLTGAMGVDISGSLSIGVGIPKGFIDLTGAIGGVATEITEAGASLANREPGRAAEHLLPTGLANPLRAMRESKEGATTRNRRRVWDEKGKPYVPGTGASIARGFGFRSTEQAVLSERTWEGHREQGKISDRRNSIYERYRAWMLGGRDRDEYKKIVKEVQDFNRFIRENRLRGESYITSQSLKNQARRMMRPSKKERSILKN